MAEIWLMLAVICAGLPVSAGGQGPPSVRTAIAEGLDAGSGRDSARALLADFYRARDFRPIWSDGRGAGSSALDLLHLLSNAAREGLDPDRYPLDSARRRIEGARGVTDTADVELLLTRMWLAYAGDVSRGRVDPAAVDSLWRRDPILALAETLRVAVDSGHPIEALRRLAPPHEGYRLLLLALARYREVAATPWEPLPDGPALAMGAIGPRVFALRERLIVLGDLSDTASSNVYDASLAAAIRRFQARHGLTADGIVAGSTLVAINVPPTVRVRQLEANLERWRWLPRTLGERYLVLNTPAFDGALVERGLPVLEFRAVFGRPDWPTPIVSGAVTSVVLHPSWHVPREIAVRELLPILRADPAHLIREGIEVLTDDGQPIDPDSIEWGTVSNRSFRFRFVQAPGPRNPLGPVKLEFTNQFAVSLHGTPQAEQFDRLPRAFSHGCVRIERVIDLASHLLRDQPLWSRDSIKVALESGRQSGIAVTRPTPVVLAYWTAWVNASGSVEFRDDVYGWDVRLLEALQRRPP